MKNSKNIIIMKLNKIVPHSEKQIFKTKSLFGGYSIYYQDVMFAWIHNSKLHLKGHKDYIQLFMDLKMAPLEYAIGVKAKLLQYYKVTPQIWNDEKRLEMLVLMVINYACKEKSEFKKLKEERIKDLPNMNLSLERLLFRVGIISVEVFRKKGAITAYHQLVCLHPKISINILFALYSALIGKHVALLTDEEKLIIKAEYQAYADSTLDS